MSISVNLAARQLEKRESPPTWRQALAASGLDAKCLALEYTETLPVAGPCGHVRQTHRASPVRVRLAIDDFGTGWLFTELPAPVPDQHSQERQVLLAGIDVGPKESAFAPVRLGQTLHLEMVAKGIGCGPG